MRRLILVVLVAACVAAGWGLAWLFGDLRLAAPAVELPVESGATPKEVAQLAATHGVEVSPQLLYAWFRLSGQARAIKAGNYELRPPLTPYSLLQLLVRGDSSLEAVTLVEGWTLRQMLEALSKEERLKRNLRGLEPENIMKLLDRPGEPAEGRFFPDTYLYARGSSDLDVLRRAARAMDHHLQSAWQQRAPDLPLKSPQELLILASIVEKETGRAADRSLVAGVFINRLRLGMPLQTDPTVIYGMGERFDGNLRKRDLLTDTPWNTYTRTGLPPTPIANPGKAALMAAAQPAKTRALYFVARGDGSSQFSETLAEHNRAVNRYQRGGQP